MTLSNYVPFYSIMLGWLLPAVIGAAIGMAVSVFRGEAVVPTLNEREAAE